nr:uncharacterized protein LOC117849205 [Setaria viridis]
MASEDDKQDEQLQDMRTQIEGIAVDIKTMHERMDSTVTTANERFDQLDLAQTATMTMLDTIVSRLDALNTMVTDFQKDYGGDTEQDGGDRRGRAHRIISSPHRSAAQLFSFLLQSATTTTNCLSVPISSQRHQFTCSAKPEGQCHLRPGKLLPWGRDCRFGVAGEERHRHSNDGLHLRRQPFCALDTKLLPCLSSTTTGLPSTPSTTCSMECAKLHNDVAAMATSSSMLSCCYPSFKPQLPRHRRSASPRRALRRLHRRPPDPDPKDLEDSEDPSYFKRRLSERYSRWSLLGTWFAARMAPPTPRAYTSRIFPLSCGIP